MNQISNPSATDARTGSATAFSSDDVYRTLRDEILTLRLEPGEALTENSIAARFGLSRTPVRAIFSKLAQDGLINLQGRKGTTISLIDLDMAEQIIFMRIQIEYGVMRYLIRHPDAMLFEKLERNLDAQLSIVNGLYPGDAFYLVDSEFHGLCMESAKKSKLWQLTQNVGVHYTRYRYLDYHAFQRDRVYDVLYKEHQQLLDIIRSRNESELYHAISAHLYGGIIRIGNDMVNNYSSFFAPSQRSIDDILRDVRMHLMEMR